MVSLPAACSLFPADFVSILACKFGVGVEVEAVAGVGVAVEDGAGRILIFGRCSSDGELALSAVSGFGLDDVADPSFSRRLLRIASIVSWSGASGRDGCAGGCSSEFILTTTAQMLSPTSPSGCCQYPTLQYRSFCTNILGCQITVFH